MKRTTLKSSLALIVKLSKLSKECEMLKKYDGDFYDRMHHDYEEMLTQSKESFINYCLDMFYAGIYCAKNE